jgi:hypothetical protein
MDPAGSFTYAIAVTLSAVLAALFTYLYVRKIGLGLIASAAAGWTFACNGFYAARIAAGHLPLLEAYPALPLLLWVAESLIQAEERDESPRRWIVGVASPPDEPFTLLDLPLAVEMMDNEFDQIVDMTVGEELVVGEYTFLRVE